MKILKIMALVFMLLVSSMSGLAYYSNGYNGYGNSYGNNYNAYGNSNYLVTSNWNQQNYFNPYGVSGNTYGNHNSYKSLPNTNPGYEQYFNAHSFMRQDKYQSFHKRVHYQEHVSPYMIVSSPYGKRPWFKPYGDGNPRITNNAWNPFFGFPYTRAYNCHGATACHYHNIFPNS